MMTEGYEFSAKFLRQARRKRGLSQMDLAQLIGAHRTSIVRWESGDYHPTARQLTRLAEVLETDPRCFYGMEAAPAELPATIEEPLKQPEHPLEADPWLSQVPWETVQAMTPGALRFQGLSLQKMGDFSGIDPERLRAIIQGKLAEPDEVLALRKSLGERFNPTPLLARTITPLAKRPGRLAGLSDSAKIDFLVEQFERLEVELFKLRDQLLLVPEEESIP